jgi:hypothetical protein
VQLADGSLLDPEDPVTFAALCELIPILYDAVMLRNMEKAKGKGPRTGPVSLIGPRQGGAMAVPGAGAASPFGGTSPMGQMGGAVGGWGGGGGAQGATGAQGPRGFGGVLDSITKTDGDFSAGPGAFVAVPGTALAFNTQVAGPAYFFVEGTAGNSISTGGDSQSGQIGLRIDGVDYPVATRLIHTFVGGVAEFMLPISLIYPIQLAAGAHSVELLIRGLAAFEFSGSGLGIPFGFCAVSSIPLILSVAHN